jgi:hypothetical protein
MILKHRLLIWLLENRPDWYVRLKKIHDFDITQDSEFLKLHAELLRDERGIQSMEERYNLYSLCRATAKLPGVVAEAGVYRGGSAKILCRAKGDTPLYLFDSFIGLPPVEKAFDGVFSTGDFHDTTVGDVKSYLKEFPNVHFYPGFFPASVRGLEPENLRYRLVHLDLDLRQSTLDALEFFYPRLVPGGVLLSHDYRRRGAPGVKTAFDEFFAKRNEPILLLPGTHGAFVKTS